MLSLLSSVTHEVMLWRSHMKSSAIINKVVVACSQCERVMLSGSEMFADDECDFSTGKSWITLIHAKLIE